MLIPVFALGRAQELLLILGESQYLPPGVIRVYATRTYLQKRQGPSAVIRLTVHSAWVPNNGCGVFAAQE